MIPEQIQKRQIKGYHSWCPYGWINLIVELDRELSQVDPNYQLAQCKEKFGGLRYYVDLSDSCKDLEKADNIIRKYELISEQTCDACGKPGINKVINGWFATRCEEHEEKQ